MFTEFGSGSFTQLEPRTCRLLILTLPWKNNISTFSTLLERKHFVQVLDHASIFFVWLIFLVTEKDFLTKIKTKNVL